MQRRLSKYNVTSSYLHLHVFYWRDQKSYPACLISNELTTSMRYAFQRQYASLIRHLFVRKSTEAKSIYKGGRENSTVYKIKLNMATS